MLRPSLALLLLLATAACHKAPAAVAGLNPDDAAQLNNAADMLDTSADDLAAPDAQANDGGNGSDNATN